MIDATMAPFAPPPYQLVQAPSLGRGSGALPPSSLPARLPHHTNTSNPLTPVRVGTDRAIKGGVGRTSLSPCGARLQEESRRGMFLAWLCVVCVWTGKELKEGALG